jgi:glucose 1-dehydrogenase
MQTSALPHKGPPLTGKVALVTGGGSGIGKAIVQALARDGAAVTIDYSRSAASAGALEAQIIKTGGRAIAVKGDVTQVKDIWRLVDRTVEEFGGLDILVNNAGIESRTSVLETTEQEYDRVLSVNLRGAFFAMQIAAKQMIKQGRGGRIINISSVHEDWPMPGNLPYCCAKGGVRMLTRTAGVALAAHGITVVGVGPGAVATPINAETLADPAKKRQLEKSIPLGRIASADEIANLVAWLASPASAYVTATTIFADGGMMQRGSDL